MRARPWAPRHCRVRHRLCSSSSDAGTTRDGATPPSDICHLSTTNEASYPPPLAQIRNRPRNRAKSTSVPPRLEGLRAASWIAGLEPRPTAAICYSDSIALGPFQDLAHEGLYPGKNFAVIGHEDVEEANLVSSSLSVTKVSRDEMGRQAAAALLEQIDHLGASPQRIVPKTELIVSETCGVVPSES